MQLKDSMTPRVEVLSHPRRGSMKLAEKMSHLDIGPLPV